MKILLAEDDLITSEIIKEQLQQWGYDVTCTYTGIEAWNILQADGSPKLVVMDWHMPGMSGPTLCQKLRAALSGTYTYIILLTGLREKAHIIQGLEAGADDYLVKPCNPNELKTRIQVGQRILSLEAELLSTLNQMRGHAYQPKNSIYNTELIGRELEILKLVANGKTTDEIANTFHLSPNWVTAHLSNIMAKMNVNTVEEIQQKALQDGFK